MLSGGDPNAAMVSFGVDMTGHFADKSRRVVTKAREIFKAKNSSGASASEPEPEFMVKWLECLCSSSPEELEEYFAKLLAGEVEKQGTYSNRTMSILADMSSEDANLFADYLKRRYTFEQLRRTTHPYQYPRGRLVVNGRADVYYMERQDKERLIEMKL